MFKRFILNRVSRPPVFLQTRNMKKIIVDCDPGIDDAYALQFLLNSKNVEIKAITT